MDFISVIVAVRNEEEYIIETLDSLLDQSIDFYEILVIDGASEDNTLSLIEAYRKEHPERIRIFQNPKKRQVFARNIGIAHARGNYTAYIDGHTMAEPNWLETLYNTLRDAGETVAGVGSVHRSPLSEKFVQRAITELFASYVGGFRSSYRRVSELKEVRTAPFVLYSRYILEKVGCYDERMLYGEDFDLNYRITKEGYTLLLQPKAVTYYRKRETVKAFIHQMYKYGKGRAYILKKHPDSFKIFYLSPVMFFLFSFLPIFSWIFPIFPYFFIMYYGMWVLTFFLSSINMARKKADLRFLFCTVLYVLEYFCYGLGLVYTFLRVRL